MIFRIPSLQSRDPFSGDCDPRFRADEPGRRKGYACRAETRSQGIATGVAPWGEADPRGGSGLQSRDPFSGDCDSAQSRRANRAASWLAEPRPVLRGLRPSHSLSSPSRPRIRACRAETRSQGIATHARVQCARRGLVAACRAETRSQGIATLLGQRHWRRPDLALQSRDPFSGDCDTRRLEIEDDRRLDDACRAETRSQGIATRTVTSPRERPSRITSLQSRDPFSGDCDEGKGWRVHLAGCDACRAETRSQGIATRFPGGGENHEGYNDLQSRDPFSGDCDCTVA